MKISLYTQIAPRLEVFFLEEWISHNLMIGVDKIFIYNNGFFSNDVYGRGRVWKKKPYINYFFEYSDEEITEKLKNVINKFGDVVSLVNWSPLECGNAGTFFCQTKGYKHCVYNNKSDWWICIDPDEYILSKKYMSIREFICNQDTERYKSFVLRQRICGERILNEPIRGVTKSANKPHSGSVVGNTKTIICNQIKKFSQHQPKPLIGETKIVENKDLLYNHYRGCLGVMKTREEFEKKMSRVCVSHNYDMTDFLKKHETNLKYTEYCDAEISEIVTEHIQNTFRIFKGGQHDNS